VRNVLRNKHEVAHYWANRVQASGRGGNVFFEGDSIYSYGKHFEIARLYRVGKVAPTVVAVFTTRTYSSTTAQHQAACRSAASHLRCIDVHDPACSAKDQFKETAEQIAGHVASAKRARTRKDWYMARAAELAEDFNTYAEIRGEKIRIDTTSFDALADKIAAARKREALAERKRQAAEQARRAEELKTNIAAWRAGGWAGYLGDTPTMLRVKGDVVQTSRNAEVPVAAAKRLWPLVQAARNGDDVSGYRGRPVGHYELTRIEANGDLVIGCHHIPYDEIERVAAELGLLELATTD
jgi:hypothetical protein